MISIKGRDSRAIYEQVCEQYRRLIISGVLLPDEKLPSVRELAASLAINPNTIQRAYRELEADGYIYSLPGKGSFIGDFRESGEEKKRELFKKFDEIAAELFYFGVSASELCSRLEGEALK